MTQPLFLTIISTQSRFAYFLTIKNVVRKFSKSDSQTEFWCLDKAVLAQGRGAGLLFVLYVGPELIEHWLEVPRWGHPVSVTDHDCAPNAGGTCTCRKEWEGPHGRSLPRQPSAADHACCQTQRWAAP